MLAIVPVYAPQVGDHVFYVHETVAGDARRVISQQLISLQAPAGAPLVVETVFTLREPDRWRGGGDNAEIFQSLLLQDVKQLVGC